MGIFHFNSYSPHSVQQLQSTLSQSAMTALWSYSEAPTFWQTPSGIFPLSWLSCTLNSSSLDSFVNSLGTLPESWLFESHRRRKFVKCPISVGSVPVNCASAMERLSRWLNFPIWEGMICEMEFPSSQSSLRFQLFFDLIKLRCALSALRCRKMWRNPAFLPKTAVRLWKSYSQSPNELLLRHMCER